MASRAEKTTTQVESTRRSKPLLRPVGRAALATLTAASLGVGIAHAAQPTRSARGAQSAEVATAKEESFMQYTAVELASEIDILHAHRTPTIVPFSEPRTGTGIVDLKGIGVTVNSSSEPTKAEYNMFAEILVSPDGKLNPKNVQDIILNYGNSTRIILSKGYPRKGWTFAANYLKNGNVTEIEAAVNPVTNEQDLTIIKAEAASKQALGIMRDAISGVPSSSILEPVFPPVKGEANPYTQRT